MGTTITAGVEALVLRHTPEEAEMVARKTGCRRVLMNLDDAVEDTRILLGSLTETREALASGDLSVDQGPCLLRRPVVALEEVRKLLLEAQEDLVSIRNGGPTGTGSRRTRRPRA